MRKLLSTFILALVVGCASGEGLLATEVAATTARQAGEQGARAGKLTKAQAQFVQTQADLIVAGVKEARSLRLTNPSAAQNQYQLTADKLRALQTFLLTQGVSQ